MPLTGYRMSLHGPGAELDGRGGVFKYPSGSSRSAPSTGPAQVTLYLVHVAVLNSF